MTSKEPIPIHSYTPTFALDYNNWQIGTKSESIFCKA